jgi:hypothetical protein
MLASLWVPLAIIQLTVPPTLMVVTGVPLSSSRHVRPTFLTVAVIGAVGGGGVGVEVGVAVAVSAG